MKTKHFFLKIWVLMISLSALNCSSDDTNSPLIANDLIINLNELPLSNGDLIGTIVSNKAATFNIVNQSVAGALTIDSASGNLTIANFELFDFEINPVIQATVNVSSLLESVEANVTINLNDIDEIEYYLLDSKDDYINAENGQWIIITLEEYDVLATQLNNVSKSGFIDNGFDDFITLSGITPTTNGITVANDNGATIPIDSYCFAFKYNNRSTHIETTQVKISTSGADNGYSNFGSVLPLHNDSIFIENQGLHAFVLKGNDVMTASEGFLAVYSISFIAYKTVTESTTYYTNYGNVSELNTLGDIPNRMFIYQGLSTTQKQWD